MKKLFLTFSLFVLFILSSLGQEGMWMLTQLGQLDLQNKGLQIPTSDIYAPGKPALYQAVVQLGGGTASFVSPDGLLLTNHHVAYTALQRASEVDQNYINAGFLARNRKDEIKAPGYKALLLLETKDVTDEVINAAKGITDPTERDRKINVKIADMTAAMGKDKKDIQAVIAEMFSGRQYMLFIYKSFKDIRLVYSPPLSIGNYGGETDNWMWPRHTGDFSFLRVYVAPDGTGSEYSPDNVPYKPVKWLKVAQQPLREGDFTMIIGFPGFTTRYRDYNSANWNFTYNYPFMIENFTEVISLAEETTKNDPEGRIKVASLTKGLANVLKNTQGKMDGMRKTHFIEKKLEADKAFAGWLDGNATAKAKYRDIQPETKALYDKLEKTRERDNVLGLFQGLSGLQLNMAGQAYITAKEMEKPEKDRQPGYTPEAVEELLAQLQYAYADYYEPLDKALFARALRIAAGLPEGQRLPGIEYILSDKSKSIDQFAGEAYKKSKLNDLEYAKGLFKMTPKQLEALDNPFIQMAAALYPVMESSRLEYEKFAASVTELRMRYLEALYEWKGSGLYPDANSTMRFTSGPVKGYDPADAVTYHPFTSLKGVVDKNTGKEPFDAPQGLIDLYNNKDYGRWSDPVLKSVPVAFTHQCDITGGNSGSPVMNARGELIGVVFDGNYEAMISDWQYDFDLQRAISVDIRYVLFVTDKFAKAGFILDEMGVKH